ncbi:hypothetical protein [Streptomyces spiramenti]|uniref:DUF7848 domain-containing protein n=1 Tax=Streptomyces spiramenti TaxID=2720606 RepID=A0ABX1AS22_9ACTN|nr:hypothetical protein [Streptomyces spiramenti]NJP67860.1 hypothetical protein [Streptomyces spiramenti]
MTRLLRLRKYTLSPAALDGSLPQVHRAHCTTCGTTGRDAADSDAATTWPHEHVRDRPAHLEYTEDITRPYQLIPGQWR